MEGNQPIKIFRKGEKEMKKIWFVLLVLALAILACGGSAPEVVPTAMPTQVLPTPTPQPEMPQQFIEVLPGIKGCLEQAPDVLWDWDFDVDENSFTSSAEINFDPRSQKARIFNVSIGGASIPEKQGLALIKETCYVGIVVQTVIDDCLISWDPLQICVPKDVMGIAIDAFSTSYLSVEEQELFFGGIAEPLHLNPGQVDFSCNTLLTFQSWSEAGVIIPGDWSPLLNAQGCTP